MFVVLMVFYTVIVNVVFVASDFHRCYDDENVSFRQLRNLEYDQKNLKLH